ncbi:hypothetical protein GOP47_0010777 [Adiantum capillus-veneris]|uniref:RING-type E3 ubiquitin transferase n=1 Tax=Adiantum capillus-veneris TaxID=13818 RepID=A0A9D4ZJ20_ADICA|nr:hypothetical protein GOP47_0010777 [Adiantum capillus-veneris]
MPTKRILCKYFKQGACFKGDGCEFSHDWRDPDCNVCTYYQSGNCAYGSSCRYEHVKLKRPESVTPARTSTVAAHTNFGTVGATSGALSRSSGGNSEAWQNNLSSADIAWQEHSPFASYNGGWQEAVSYASADEGWPLPSSSFQIRNEVEDTPKYNDPSEEPICALAATGRCTRGESCPYLHGDRCSLCGKECLHPHRPEERDEHRRQCERNQKRLEALRFSQDIECSICLDRVLSKPTNAERKFGLLSGCDHPFCISCIRDWRSTSQPQGSGSDAIVRLCPVCRVLSYYVIPSVIWYSNVEEKQEIIDGYKARVRDIDCKHFDFGNGRCQFGTSCFYKHAFRDGTTEEVKLRHLGAADGNTVIAKDVRLSEFLGRLNLRR